MDKTDKLVTYETTCKRNPTYPKVRLLCGELHRLKNPTAPIERLTVHGWVASV